LYSFIKKYLQKGYFEDEILDKKKGKKIIAKSRPYTLYEEKLYKLGPNAILRDNV
jgi:hypothetical protein